jgi:hypothetical protein
VLTGSALEQGAAASRALGVDREGFLLYAESEVAQPGLLFRVMEQAGATPALALADGARLGLESSGQWLSVDGKQELAISGGLAFLAETRPAAGVMFPEVKPMPYQRWGFLQGQRVRYFPSGPPRFPAPPEVLAAPPKGALAPPKP